jgi:hypothetical protein
MPNATKSNISALAPILVALSHGLPLVAGEGFGPLRERALAWCKEADDTIYKVQERAPSDPAPAGSSEAPEGTESGRAGATHGKVRTWDRDEVLKWLSGGDAGAIWALDCVLAHSRDNVFLDALEKLETEAMARATPRARRPR